MVSTYPTMPSAKHGKGVGGLMTESVVVAKLGFAKLMRDCWMLGCTGRRGFGFGRFRPEGRSGFRLDKISARCMGWIRSPSAVIYISWST